MLDNYLVIPEFCECKISGIHSLELCLMYI